jgi:hypothetical protein
MLTAESNTTQAAPANKIDPVDDCRIQFAVELEQTQQAGRLAFAQLTESLNAYSSRFEAIDRQYR